MSPKFRPATPADFVKGAVLYSVWSGHEYVDGTGAIQKSPASMHPALITNISSSGLSFKSRDWKPSPVCAWDTTESRWHPINGYWGSRYVVLVEGA